MVSGITNYFQGSWSINLRQGPYPSTPSLVLARFPRFEPVDTVCGLVARNSSHAGSSHAGIGRLEAGKIWYRALTVNMTSSTNYAGARAATLSAASDLSKKSSQLRENQGPGAGVGLGAQSRPNSSGSVSKGSARTTSSPPCRATSCQPCSPRRYTSSVCALGSTNHAWLTPS